MMRSLGPVLFLLTFILCVKTNELEYFGVEYCPVVNPCHKPLLYDVRYRCGTDDVCTKGYKCCKSDCYIHKVCVVPVNKNGEKIPPPTETSVDFDDDQYSDSEIKEWSNSPSQEFSVLGKEEESVDIASTTEEISSTLFDHGQSHNDTNLSTTSTLLSEPITEVDDTQYTSTTTDEKATSTGDAFERLPTLDKTTSSPLSSKSSLIEGSGHNIITDDEDLVGSGHHSGDGEGSGWGDGEIVFPNENYIPNTSESEFIIHDLSTSFSSYASTDDSNRITEETVEGSGHYSTSTFTDDEDLIEGSGYQTEPQKISSLYPTSSRHSTSDDDVHFIDEEQTVTMGIGKTSQQEIGSTHPTSDNVHFLDGKETVTIGFSETNSESINSTVFVIAKSSSDLSNDGSEFLTTTSNKKENTTEDDDKIHFPDEVVTKFPVIDYSPKEHAPTTPTAEVKERTVHDKIYYPDELAKTAVQTTTSKIPTTINSSSTITIANVISVDHPNEISTDANEETAKIPSTVYSSQATTSTITIANGKEVTAVDHPNQNSTAANEETAKIPSTVFVSQATTSTITIANEKEITAVDHPNQNSTAANEETAKTPTTVNSLEGMTSADAKERTAVNFSILHNNIYVTKEKGITTEKSFTADPVDTNDLSHIITDEEEGSGDPFDDYDEGEITTLTALFSNETPRLSIKDLQLPTNDNITYEEDDEDEDEEGDGVDENIRNNFHRKVGG